MTYAYHCQSCGYSHVFTTADKDSESSTEMGGMKSSCCHKCSNPECSDHGECDCFEEFLEKQREIVLKMIEDGTFPILSPSDEDE